MDSILELENIPQELFVELHKNFFEVSFYHYGKSITKKCTIKGFVHSKLIQEIIHSYKCYGVFTNNKAEIYGIERLLVQL